MGGRSIAKPSKVKVRSDVDVEVVAEGGGVDVLVLQGRDLGEPVVQHGPFVGNTRDDITQVEPRTPPRAAHAADLGSISARSRLSLPRTAALRAPRRPHAASAQAFSDYRRTEFGGWPWPSDSHAFGRDRPRFAQFADGRVEEKPIPW